MPLAIRGRPDLTFLMIPLMIPWMLCSLHSLCSLLRPSVLMPFVLRYFVLHPSVLHPFVPPLLMILF